jgi:hypothetical protein
LDLLEELGHRLGGRLQVPTRLPTLHPISFRQPHQQDKHFGTDQYSIAEDVQEIQTEILTKGPIEAQYIVNGDFYSYDSSLSTSFIPGVYQHANGTYAGRHAVKILG